MNHIKPTEQEIIKLSAEAVDRRYPVLTYGDADRLSNIRINYQHGYQNALFEFFGYNTKVR